MKSAVKLLAFCMFFVFYLFGCGGGSSSSTTETIPNTSTSSPDSLSPPSASEQSSSLTINPIADLGLVAGNKVCFRIKAYNNFLESEFSNAVCGEIKNDHNLTLSWDRTTEDVSGYYVYFGTNKNNATNFLADVIES